MTAYRIAEVAERSGFTPATLRYYEDIGLVAPTGRTPAGYRQYDDASLARLRFIARAKQLGCSLDEVADLATAWDGGRCGPVQDRLRATVESKVADTRVRIAELTSLAADLQQALAALGTHRPDGPCDDACGCTSDPDAPGSARVAAPVHLTAVPSTAAADRPAGDDGVPIACSLGGDEMSGRLDDWQRLLSGGDDPQAGVAARRAVAGGVRLEMGPHADVAEIARLAAAEQGCCRFFDFALVIDARGTALEVRAPAEAADLVTALFGATG